MSAALAIPAHLRKLVPTTGIERARFEATLGPRSFKAFVLMAWKEADPAILKWNWHLDVLCEEMQAAARREKREMVVCVPPRSLKSVILGVMFPAWVWTWDPAAKFITASHEMTLATRDAVKCRRLVQSKWYQDRWGPKSPFLGKGQKGVAAGPMTTPPDTLYAKGKYVPDPQHAGVAMVADQNNKTYYETSAGGHRFCATPARMVTGHGADFILGDDLNHIMQAESAVERGNVLTWWREVISTRLNEQDRGVKIVIQQRVHVEDVAGDCISKGYHKVVFPMEFDPEHPDKHPRDPRQPGEILHKARITPEALQKLKTALGPYAASGQLQQQPVPRAGGIFQRHWFQIVEQAPAVAMRNMVRRWDLAGTLPEPGTDPDWTASVLMGKDELGRVFILAADRLRDTSAQVDAAIKALATQDGGNCRLVLPKDPGAAGKARAEAQQRFLAPRPVKFVAETGDKAERARGLASAAEMGNVFLVRGKWNGEFLDELCGFPTFSHDDWVDAASGAYTELFGGGSGILEWYRQQAQKEMEQDAIARATSSEAIIRGPLHDPYGGNTS